MTSTCVSSFAHIVLGSSPKKIVLLIGRVAGGGVHCETTLNQYGLIYGSSLYEIVGHISKQRVPELLSIQLLKN